MAAAEEETSGRRGDGNAAPRRARCDAERNDAGMGATLTCACRCARLRGRALATVALEERFSRRGRREKNYSYSTALETNCPHIERTPEHREIGKAVRARASGSPKSILKQSKIKLSVLVHPPLAPGNARRPAPWSLESPTRPSACTGGGGGRRRRRRRRRRRYLSGRIGDSRAACDPPGNPSRAGERSSPGPSPRRAPLRRREWKSQTKRERSNRYTTVRTVSPSSLVGNVVGSKTSRAPPSVGLARSVFFSARSRACSRAGRVDPRRIASGSVASPRASLRFASLLIHPPRPRPQFHDPPRARGDYAVRVEEHLRRRLVVELPRHDGREAVVDVAAARRRRDDLPDADVREDGRQPRVVVVGGGEGRDDEVVVALVRVRRAGAGAGAVRRAGGDVTRQRHRERRLRVAAEGVGRGGSLGEFHLVPGERHPRAVVVVVTAVVVAVHGEVPQAQRAVRADGAESQRLHGLNLVQQVAAAGAGAGAGAARAFRSAVAEVHVADGRVAVVARVRVVVVVAPPAADADASRQRRARDLVRGASQRVRVQTLRPRHHGALSHVPHLDHVRLAAGEDVLPAMRPAHVVETSVVSFEPVHERRALPVSHVQDATEPVEADDGAPLRAVLYKRKSGWSSKAS
eukprot:31527-Pelagococcus_subviridis.AAC.16